MPAGVDFVLNVEIRKLGFSWLDDLFETRAGTGSQPGSKARAWRKARSKKAQYTKLPGLKTHELFDRFDRAQKNVGLALVE